MEEYQNKYTVINTKHLLYWDYLHSVWKFSQYKMYSNNVETMQRNIVVGLWIKFDILLPYIWMLLYIL